METIIPKSFLTDTERKKEGESGYKIHTARSLEKNIVGYFVLLTMHAIKPAETGRLEIHANDPIADSLLSYSLPKKLFQSSVLKIIYMRMNQGKISSDIYFCL